MAQRLTSAHPLYKKLEALENWMKDHNIEIYMQHNGRLVLKDKETDMSVDIRDLDSGEPVDSIPSMFEWKLIIPGE